MEGGGTETPVFCLLAANPAVEEDASDHGLLSGGISAIFQNHGRKETLVNRSVFASRKIRPTGRLAAADMMRAPDQRFAAGAPSAEGDAPREPPRNLDATTDGTVLSRAQVRTGHRRPVAQRIITRGKRRASVLAIFSL